MISDKKILDACCGSRMFWFDKENPLTMFLDIRDEEITACDGRSIKVRPDLIADFRNIPFEANSFKPLLGHKSGKASKTHWLLFMKTVSDN